jgi:acetoin utilization deacetylase AcuC-like enzyme
VAGEVANAYALVRPPGHHATRSGAMGFCLFANAALAGRAALDDLGLGRVAFVDWDVHHGNGTQDVFWEDPRALTLSIHQDGCFPPDSGHVGEIGAGAGEGFNINVPLPPGSGLGAYAAAFDRVVLPALHAYKPDLIIVPSGFDAGGHDPLGRMMLHSDAYRDMTRKLMTAADELCGGRIVMSHEGGYSASTVPFMGLAVLETLSGVRTDVVDPFVEVIGGMAYQGLQSHQEAAIEASAALVRESARRW